jgi:hypothetical protein
MANVRRLGAMGAAMATAWARSDPGAWSQEAEQRLEAPANGLNRDQVSQLIESCGDEWRAGGAAGWRVAEAVGR